MVILHNFPEQVVFERSLNVSFLALIPKKSDVVEVKDFVLLVWWDGCIRLYLRFWPIVCKGWHIVLSRILKMPLLKVSRFWILF